MATKGGFGSVLTALLILSGPAVAFAVSGDNVSATRINPYLHSGHSTMDSAIDIHRLHFAFTITFHYLFPQLTMGLALLIVVLKSLALWKWRPTAPKV